MGIYDRDYYRKEGPSYLGSLLPSGPVCKWLIGINILVFILQLITFVDFRNWGPITDAFELDTARVLDGQIWRLLTYSFLHSPMGIWHIFFNMLFLWWFGSELEQMYGSREFLAFYLVSALVGGIAFQIQALVQGAGPSSVGASGAVTAVMVLYAFYFPNRIILIFFILPVPIWLVVLFQVAQDSFHLFGSVQTSTAVAVHLGGAAFGALYYKLHWRILDLGQGWQLWWKQMRQPRLRVYRPEEEEPVSVAAQANQDLDEHLDAKLDAVLEKLSRHGRDSLTENERAILMRASEIYKKKRT